MAKLTEAQVIAGLVARDVPRHVAQGVAMNFQDESGFDTGITGSDGDFGLAQWHGPRRAALERYASAHGKPVDDPDLQLDFFMVENAGQEAEAWKKVLATSNAKDAAIAFVNEWERPEAEYAQRRSAKYASMTPRVSGPVEAAGGGSGSDSGAPQLHSGPAVAATAPVVDMNDAYNDLLASRPEQLLDRPRSLLADTLASSVGRKASRGDSGGLLPSAADQNAPMPLPELPPSAVPEAAPEATPEAPVITPLAELFKVKEIGLPNEIDPLTGQPRPFRSRRAYG